MRRDTTLLLDPSDARDLNHLIGDRLHWPTAAHAVVTLLGELRVAAAEGQQITIRTHVSIPDNPRTPAGRAWLDRTRARMWREGEVDTEWLL